MPNVRMKCATSLRYARRVRGLLRLASQISSSGIAASWSTLIRWTPPRLDGTIAFMVLFFSFFITILVLYIIRDNSVYQVLAYHDFPAVKSGGMHIGVRRTLCPCGQPLTLQTDS